MVDQLVTALDSSLYRAKVTVAAVTGVLLAVGAIALDVVSGFPLLPWGLVGIVATALFLLAVVSLCTFLITRQTFVELERLRPARLAEIREGLIPQTLRLMAAVALVVGPLIGLVFVCRAAPAWLAGLDVSDSAGWLGTLVGAVTVARLLVEALCWLVLALAVLQLGPLVVIEETSILRSIREWLGMFWRHLGRVYLYEALALGVALIVALPLLLVVGLAAGSVESLGLVERVTLWVLAGVALTPLIVYLAVANVLIYLNLRYEFSHAPRGR
jgi:hypothetical protein